MLYFNSQLNPKMRKKKEVIGVEVLVVVEDAAVEEAVLRKKRISSRTQRELTSAFTSLKSTIRFI
jgi:hypothetical protein